MKRILWSIICALLLLSPNHVLAQESLILMASTIGPVDAGIVEALEGQFEKESGIRVRHVGAGTGEALKIGQQGSVDLVMVHAKKLEEKFIKEGFGTERIPFMYNDFIIVGPAGDPAGIRGMTNATEALKKIAVTGAPFISRGDNSGTHIAELALWGEQKPEGTWYTVYQKGNEGNVPTLRYTSQSGAYTVIDRATFLTLKDVIKLEVLVENDEVLLNRITLIPVNPVKSPRVDHSGARKFVDWLTAPDKGQKLVRDFGKEKYGSPLFFPDSDEWRASQLKQKAP